jgi:hypothetical protein
MGFNPHWFHAVITPLDKLKNELLEGGVISPVYDIQEMKRRFQIVTAPAGGMIAAYPSKQHASQMGEIVGWVEHDAVVRMAYCLWKLRDGGGGEKAM